MARVLRSILVSGYELSRGRPHATQRSAAYNETASCSALEYFLNVGSFNSRIIVFFKRIDRPFLNHKFEKNNNNNNNNFLFE